MDARKGDASSERKMDEGFGGCYQEEAVDKDIEEEGCEERAGILRREEGDLDRHYRGRIEQQCSIDGQEHCAEQIQC